MDSYAKLRNALVAITLPEMFEVLFSMEPEFKHFTLRIARELLERCELNETEQSVVRSFIHRFE